MTRPFSTATPDSAMNPTPAEIESGMSRSHSASDAARQRERHAAEDRNRSTHRPEREEEQRENDEQRHGHDDAQPLRSRDELLEGAAVVDPVARRCLQVAIERRSRTSATNPPRSRPRTFAVTTTRRLPFSRLTWFGPVVSSICATSRSGTNCGSPPAQLAPRETSSSFGCQVRGIGRSASHSGLWRSCLGQSHDDVRASIAFDELPGDRSADRRTHRALNVARIEAVSRERLAIRIHDQHRQSRRFFDANVRGAGHCARDVRRSVAASRFNVSRSSPIDLDRHIRAHAGDQLVHSHLDRLRELVVVARQRSAPPLRSPATSSALALARIGPRRRAASS